METATLLIGDEEAHGTEDEEKPLRFLTDWVVFDVAHQHALVSLDSVLESNSRQVQAYGKVGQAYANEEDAGQDAAADEPEDQLQSLCTTAILRVSLDYADSEG
jgi:hypothetical protein